MEALAFGLSQLGIIWVLVAAGAIVIATQVKGRWLRAALVLVPLVSIPAYVLIVQRLDDREQAENLEAQRKTASQEAVAFKAICALPAKLTVTAPVKSGKPADLRVQDPVKHRLLQLDLPRRPACWLQADERRCASPNIANVQYVLPASECKTPDAPGSTCSLTRGFHIPTQKDAPLPELTAPYILDVRGERVSPHIERFRVTVIDSKDKAVLGETVIHRRNPLTGGEPQYCPERHGTVGKLLEAVFPPAKSN